MLAELASHGYTLLNADRVLAEGSGVPTKLVDMEELGQVFGCLEGAEAVVHLAAIPRPTFHTNEVVFRTNVLGTYHLFEAAAQLRIPRIVWASSVSVLGYPFNYHRFAPAYLPIDEEHPCLPQDPYALSKRLGRRDGRRLRAPQRGDDREPPLPLDPHARHLSRANRSPPG